MKINNMPDYAWQHKYIVYRIADNGEKWFFGAYDEISKSLCAMIEVNGSIAAIEDVEGYANA